MTTQQNISETKITFLPAILALCLFCNASESVSQDQELDGIAELARHKQNAEQLVKLLKQEQKKIGQKKLTNCKVLYADASSAFNGWIEQTQVDLLQKDGKLEQKSQEPALRFAVGKSRNFTDYAQKVLTQGEIRAPVLNVDIEKMITATWNIIKEILHNKSQEREKVRNDLLKRLDMLKWKQFDEI